MNIKPYAVILVHEDEPKEDGVPIEIVAYTWTEKGGQKIQERIWTTQPEGKWMAVMPNSWHWWWTLYAGSAYEYHGLDVEGMPKMIKISWWRKERLWTALWRLARGRNRDRHSSN